MRKNFMLEIYAQLAPIFFYFLIGVVLRRTALADTSHGDFLLRLTFFVTLPLLILLTLANANLTVSKALLPLANIVVNLLCLGLALLMSGRLQLSRQTVGSLAMSTMIANNAFMFPFILAIYGESGFADSILFDFGNALMVATVTYATAFRFSEEPYERFAMLRRIVRGPIFWSLAIGTLLSLSGTPVPASLETIVRPVADMTAPLILIALGIFFSFRLDRPQLVALAISIRMGAGLAFGLAFATLVGLEGETFAVVALCSAAPIGFMALTFSSLAKLDMPLTINSISLSILIGLLYIPVLVFFLG